MRLRRAGERGHFNHGWLETWHTFNFADYFDPDHENFRSLRVINEDIVAPGRGFGTHGHRDMEIITYVLAGSLEHRDSLGHGGLLKRDTIQRMRAGTGIRHSEANPDPDKPLHLFQIWIVPKTRSLAAAYEDRHFDPQGALGQWQLLVSPDGAEGSLDMAQDAHLWRVFLQPGEEVSLTLPMGESHAYLQLASGEAELFFGNDGPVALAGQLDSKPESAILHSSDGAAMSDVRRIHLKARQPTEALLFGLV